MASDRKEYARNLKIVATTPKEIDRQQQAFRNRLAEIKQEEQRKIYGEATLNKWRDEARVERDRTGHALAKRMRASLDYIAANNDYASNETIDFTSTKLKDALRTIDYMGADLSPADQAAMLSSFAGDIGALRVLEKAFRKNKLYMANAAHEMQKSIDQQAIKEAYEVLAFHDYAETQNRFDFPAERMMWTHGAFQKQLDRLNLVDDTTDPYSAVLDAVSDQIRADMDSMSEDQAEDKAKRQAELWKIQSAKKEMQQAQERGENPATVLNRELAKLDKPAAGADA